MLGHLSAFWRDWLEAWRVLLAPKDPMRYALPENERGPWIKARSVAPKTDGVKLPENVRHIPGTNVVVMDTKVMENGQAIVETTVVTPGTEGRVKHLTDTDRQELAAAKLDAVKAALVKPYWAEGCSTKDAAATIAKTQNSRGYSERSLDAYWAAFHRAHAPAIPQPTGERPHPYEVEW